MSGPHEAYNEEQRIVIALLRSCGEPNPEAIVDSDRVTAAKMGAALRPVLQSIVTSLASLIASLDGSIGVIEDALAEDPAAPDPSPPC